ncbi:polysaccharide biosynthesis/export family protein [Paracidobacterium acidisoli]|uniref:Polysaccharide export protein n=1 Tax=Paracidobacterium acidisoli TaxID=2303751 RepID=A0A372ITG4_9BACT|nr:polysaccharide biosynthesis/export family protein [Paracidobacterium acidisoli]MBT9329478.1 polysaccharide biosynthesis/export family protein [Paracidobacterium acidisoli]
MAGLALKIVCCCVAAWLALAPAGAQQSAPTESLLIGPGDLLHVSVLSESELERRARVRDSGDVALPLIGNVSVKGLTPADAAAAIAEQYRKGNFLKHPEVSVLIEEYATQSVAVLGQIARPGAIQLATPRSLIDVLSMAGGLTETADRHITLHRAGKDGDTVQVYLPNNAAQDLHADVMVYPGDTVIVPKAGIIYVLGDVGRPGGYVMQNDSKMTVLEAIAMAAGAGKTASDRKIRLIHNADGQYVELDLPLRAMENGKQPDVALHPSDVLYVPFSFAKNVAMGSTSILAAASTALIYADR